ncbi:hypothetical protein HanHA89_Chr01g0013161 [Helianthus annuus]|nr:hypothetical protein HanHA89_Chr01g0013161 [Helianthus annuus]
MGHGLSLNRHSPLCPFPHTLQLGDPPLASTFFPDSPVLAFFVGLGFTSCALRSPLSTCFFSSISRSRATFMISVRVSYFEGVMNSLYSALNML